MGVVGALPYILSMNSNKLECIMQCEPDTEMSLVDPEVYPPARQTNDGTLKWFICNKCNRVFCLDKVNRSWQFSPETYTDLVEEGLLKNKLEN